MGLTSTYKGRIHSRRHKRSRRSAGQIAALQRKSPGVLKEFSENSQTSQNFQNINVEEPSTSSGLQVSISDKSCDEQSGAFVLDPEESFDDKENSDPYNFKSVTIPDFEEINAHELCVELEEDTSDLSGFRIVEIKYLLETAMSLQTHHNRSCTGGKLVFSKEVRSGLVSTFTYICNVCNKEEKIYSENPNEQPIVNSAAVWGTIAIGSTHAHMEEFLSVLDIPAMNGTAFYKMQRKLGTIWKKSLWDAMESAGAEERRLAIESGNIDKDGIPFVSVYLDGGWSKRSYGHSYNAASGVAVIIGEATSKLLFIGVRNKYCSICSRAENKNETAKAHICFKNWTGSSTAMEADIIVEGFNNSIAMHNLRYTQIIADGDSTVLARIRQKVDYGKQVMKAECTNHVTKNYGKYLRLIKNDTKTVSLQIRKMLGNTKTENRATLERLVKAAQRAIYANALGDVEVLKSDLRNTVHHVFGNHSKCREQLCHSVGDVSQDETKELYSTGAHHHIFGALNLLISKAKEIIYNKTNNRAELFMSILARFNMGKRLNLIGRDAFEMRSYLTGLRYNEGHAWHVKAWKRWTEKNPGKYFEKYIQVQTSRSSKRKEREWNEPRTSKKKYFGSTAKNVEYGSNIAEVELGEEELKNEVQKLIERLKISEEEKLKISLETIGQFNNQRYLTERMHRLTASNFGAVIRRKKITSCHSLVKSILGNSSFSTPAMEYGKINESVAISRFSQETGNLVKSCGLYVDVNYGFLGASPDGIINEDEIIEVKCFQKVALSKLSLEDAVKKKDVPCLEIRNNEICLKHRHNYYYQIQGQLAITNAKRCYFIVYTGDYNKIHVEIIEKDTELWTSEMLPKLIAFYENCIAPEIILNRRGKNLKCRDPIYIIEAQQKHAQKAGK